MGDMERVRNYRAAVFLQGLRADLAIARHHQMNWRADVALDLIRAALGMDSPRATSFTDVDEVSNIAARISFLLSDIQLMRLGVDAGYYPPAFDERVFELLNKEVVPSLADLARTVDPFTGVVGIAVPPPWDFSELQTNWGGAATPQFQRCLRLLAYSHEEEWSRAIGQAGELARRIQRNPALQLPSQDVDEVRWALTGTPDAEQGSLREWWWSTAFQVFWSDQLEERRTRLFEIRAAIAAMQDYLTSDPGVMLANWANWVAQTDLPDNPMVRRPLEGPWFGPA